MKPNIHLYGYIAGGFAVSLFLLASADYWWLPAASPLKDYVRGIFTETIGIIATLIFVELIFSKHQQKSEKADEIKSIARSHKILTCYIHIFEQYAYQVVTPITKRDQALFRTVPNDFTISDMRDLFLPSLLLHDGQEPVVLACVRSQQELKRCIEKFLRAVDFQHHPELSDLLLKYLHTAGTTNLLDGITHHYTATMENSTQKTFVRDLITDLIRNHRGPAEYTPHNILNTYIALHDLIKYHVNFIGEYRAIVSKIMGDSQSQDHPV